MDLGLRYWNFSADAGAQRIVETLAVAAKGHRTRRFRGIHVTDRYFQMAQRER